MSFLSELVPGWSLISVVCVDPVRSGFAERPSVSGGPKAAAIVVNAGADQHPLSIFGMFGNDVDHAIDCIRAPNRGSRPTDHLNALDIFQQHVLFAPHDAVKERIKNTAAIDQHQ